jgi:membrane protein DedA with SNARE-associated domain
VQHFISTYGYFAIFILMIAESACIPIPSELTMPLGGALASGAAAGVHLSLAVVIAVGVAGNLAGSYIAWAVGRYGAQGAWRRVTAFADRRGHRMARAQRWFDEHGARSVFIGRLLPVIRTFISLPAGFARMAPVRFGIYTVAGCVPWITALAVAGYAAGANWHRVTGLVQDAGYAVGAVAVLAAVAILIIMIRARRRRRAQPPGAEQNDATGNHTDSGRAARAPVSDEPRYRRVG